MRDECTLGKDSQWGGRGNSRELGKETTQFKLAGINKKCTQTLFIDELARFKATCPFKQKLIHFYHTRHSFSFADECSFILYQYSSVIRSKPHSLTITNFKHDKLIPTKQTKLPNT